ncbi:MotA/TolQ/ExbB proton channel family protein [Hoylesella pleuritidis]|uniref:MotA/TolQ/ExbB proton channel family protein n=1 Tax=Hoylesella pleuritidis TaxID=407975 RepID=UPI0028D20EFB|nr:MotA/TolQ/ExbB proton channel family protein [Hoylesella pleuritidis]
MNHLIVRFAISLLLLLCFSMTITAQKQGGEEQTAQQEIQNEKPDAVNRKTTNGKSQGEKPLNAGQKAVNDSAVDNNLADSMLESTITSTPDTDIEPIESAGFHQALKTKFIEGNAGFMSLVALALVIGLAFCIERIIYLSLSEINAKQFMRDLEAKINTGDIEAAKDLCRDTRGPVASICYQGLVRIDESIDNIERSVAAYGSVQAANLEKGCSWITLFIAMAPSLGFLGTVIGMVMAFDQIQSAGDISPTIVASGMKVALITTIFGIIVALILQIFYNYILSKIEHLTSQMEESAITLLDSVMKYQLKK